jgi:hypothetical protein
MRDKYKNKGSKYVRLAEECSEVIHLCCKIERFGKDNYHPLDKTKTQNTKILDAEIRDLVSVLSNDFGGVLQYLENKK